ncbi:hypothetical protein BHE74_00057238 [Ensete ventricosum]|nr:hypothetical protein BHE74_00057238 [Ensete ventricosum]
MRARDLLMEQNVALDLARQEAELAIRARNDFLAVMNHEMRIPLHAIITLSSLLLETELSPEQRSMVETVVKTVKKLQVSLMLSPDLPLCAIGDEKRLMQIMLTVAGNAVKFTKEGDISLTASVARTDYLRDFRALDFNPVATDGHFYLRVQVLGIFHT